MSRRLVRLTSRVRRGASSSETFRLTVASGIPSLRDADDRLPASTAASSVDMASSLSIGSFHYPEGWLHDLPNAGSQWKGYVWQGSREHQSMTAPQAYSSDIAFTASIKAVQARKGSRGAYRRMEENGSWAAPSRPHMVGFRPGAEMGVCRRSH